MDDKLVAPCGAYCGTCKFLNKEQKPNCLGCGRQHGKLFWGECKLYKCVKNHQVDHCGVCKDFPCNLFIGHFDPAHGQESAFTRAGLLVYRIKVGPRKFIEMSEKLKEEQK